MILIIDDDSAIRTSLSFMLKRAKYDVKAVSGPKEAIETVRETTPMLILMDMNFSLSTDGEEGLTLLRQVKLFCPDVPVILMTAWGSIPLAVKGMQAGAFDFITKPWNNSVLLQRIETALEITGKKNDDDKSDDDDIFDRSHIIGKSKALTDILSTIKRVARTGASVLIIGESGTGKELIAEAVHINSNRKNKPFVKVNLRGIPHTLFESEMFGHKKGAFTDAVTDRKGRFELADKGTIFLDEIGELELSSQVKLLRVLQEQTFEPLGDSHPKKIDVRVVCATNADLEQMVKDKKFREDLYYRINLITVHLPPLRERREDIPLLAKYFADNRCKEDGLKSVCLSDNAIKFLCSLPYPGNIRELKNLVERTLLVCGKESLDAADFQSQYHPYDNSCLEKNSSETLNGLTLDEIERQTIISTLKKYDYNLSQSALALGISRAALYRRIEKYGINI